MVDLVVWSSKDAIAPGVLRIQDEMMSVPVINKSDKRLALREGGRIGDWSTNKWKVR